MAKQYKIQSLAVKTEGVQGTPVTIAATDYTYGFDVNVKDPYEKLDRDYTRNTLDTLPFQVGKTHREVSLKVPLRGSGVTGSMIAPLQAILCACGFVPSASTSDVTFMPTSTISSSMNGPGISATVEHVRDGWKKVSAGTLFNGKIVLEAGKLPLLEANGKGIYSDPTLLASTPTGTLNTTIEPTVESVTFTMSGSTQIMTGKIEIDFGNELQELDSIAAVDGVGGYQITQHQAKGTFDIYADSNNWMAKAYAGTTFSATAVVGTTQGNKVTFTMPCIQLTDVNETNKNNLFAYQLGCEFKASSPSGSDYLSIKFS